MIELTVSVVEKKLSMNNNLCLATSSEWIDGSGYCHLCPVPSDGSLRPELETDGGTVLELGQTGH